MGQLASIPIVLATFVAMPLFLVASLVPSGNARSAPGSVLATSNANDLELLQKLGNMETVPDSPTGNLKKLKQTPDPQNQDDFFVLPPPTTEHTR